MATAKKKTNFQLVNVVLDDLLEDVKKEHGTSTNDVIKKKLKELSANYSKLSDNKFPPIDYAPAETRLAYVYTYVATHADYVYQLLTATEKHLGKHLSAQKKIVVTCLGGGPGSELVGLVQYLCENKENEIKTLTAYLCDREQAWADCWTEIGEEVDGSFNLHVNFQGLDVTNKSSWSKQKKFLSADFFLCSYFASEIARLGNAADDFWGELANEAKTDAMMLVIDNNHTYFYEYITNKIVGDTWTIVKSGELDITPSLREQKSDLGDHLASFDRSPKLKGKISYWILRKK